MKLNTKYSPKFVDNFIMHAQGVVAFTKILNFCLIRQKHNIPNNI